MRVIFVTIHHRKSLLFEKGLELILKDFPVLIYETGVDKGFGVFGLKNNVRYVESNDTMSYDQGLMNLKDVLTGDWDILHFLDNDCFITDTKYIKQTIEDFAKSDLGFCSYFERGYEPDKYKFEGTIAEVTDQKFEHFDYYPGYKPNPHWENAMMMFKREAWNKLTKEDLSYGMINIKAMFDKGIKMGVKKREMRGFYSHCGEGWFHVGNLMAYYYMMESLDISKLNPNSDIDLARIGYFVSQHKRFDESTGIVDSIYSSNIQSNLKIITNIMGGGDRCLKAWRELTKGYESIS